MNFIYIKDKWYIDIFFLLYIYIYIINDIMKKKDKKILRILFKMFMNNKKKYGLVKYIEYLVLIKKCIH